MTDINSSSSTRTGPVKGSVPLLLFLVSLCLFSVSVSAQKTEASTNIRDAVLGVGIGSGLGEAHRKLDSLGITGGRETRSGGRKQSWALDSTEFSSVSLKTNKKGKAVWVTGFLRPGREIPFEELGDIAAATRFNEFEAIWNVETPEGGYRLVAKGHKSLARVVYLLSLEAPPVEKTLSAPQ